MMHSLLAIVVSYGGSTTLHRLLPTLVAMDGCRVLLVENDTKTRHGAPLDGVRVLQGHGNVGYGTAVNIAVRHAVEDGPPPRWILVVNSDVTVPPSTAARLPELLAGAAPSVDVVGFPVQAAAGQPGRDSAVLPSPRTNAYTAIRGEAAAIDRWPELRYPVGAFFAIRWETFLRLGGFDPSYWMYYEETDLFARLYAEGGRIVWVDDVWPVVHVGGETVGRSGLLYAELGRSAAVYARRHRGVVGRSWPAVHAAQLVVLAGRKLAGGRPHDALRAARILAGLTSGLARPGWEPAASSRWSATPASTRAELGRLVAPAPPEVPAEPEAANRPGALVAQRPTGAFGPPARSAPVPRSVGPVQRGRPAAVADGREGGADGWQGGIPGPAGPTSVASSAGSADRHR